MNKLIYFKANRAAVKRMDRCASKTGVSRTEQVTEAIDAFIKKNYGRLSCRKIPEGDNVYVRIDDTQVEKLGHIAALYGYTRAALIGKIVEGAKIKID